MERSVHKNTYTLIKTEAVTFTDLPENREVFSILALETDGENVVSSFAYDVSRSEEKAKEILRKITEVSPSLSEFTEAVENIL